MIQLMKERNKYIIKHTYLTWRNHFELESYYKKAISEFSEYRKTRLMKGTLKAMSIQIKVILILNCFLNFYRKKNI